MRNSLGVPRLVTNKLDNSLEVLNPDPAVVLEAAVALGFFPQALLDGFSKLWLRDKRKITQGGTFSAAEPGHLVRAPVPGHPCPGPENRFSAKGLKLYKFLL